MSKILDLWSNLTATVLPFAGSAAPAGWLLCYGQAISRTTYATLFLAIGTTFGVGDGSATFNLPDLRGRVASGADNMGGTAAGRMNVTLTGTKAATTSGVITGLPSTSALCVGMQAFGTGIGAAAVINSIDSATQVTLSANSTSTGSTSIRFGVVDGATLGASGGSPTAQLSSAQMPAHNHGVTDPGHAHSHNAAAQYSSGSSGTGGATVFYLQAAATINAAATGVSIQNAGSGQAHSITPPTLVLNHIIKT